jgi:hypothetical protein
MEQRERQSLVSFSLEYVRCGRGVARVCLLATHESGSEGLGQERRVPNAICVVARLRVVDGSAVC